MPDYIVEQPNAAVIVLRLQIHGGWEQWFLLTSDNHHDSILCNRELEKKHLELARERDALIINLGDFFDAMQGRFDPRRSMDELRPEYRREDYFDYVVADSAEFLSPYAQNIVMLAQGNHEASVRKNQNTDLTERLRFLLNLQHKGNVMIGGYGGWMIVALYKGKSAVHTYRIKYFHGAGGEAPVTKGVIQTNRQAVYLPDADAVINGHNHNNYIVPLARERITQRHNFLFDIQYHVRIPGYKQGYGDGTAGWEVMRGGVPKPIGAVWAKMSWMNNEFNIEYTPAIESPTPVNAKGTTGADFQPYPQDSEYP